MGFLELWGEILGESEGERILIENFEAAPVGHRLTCKLENRRNRRGSLVMSKLMTHVNPNQIIQKFYNFSTILRMPKD